MSIQLIENEIRRSLATAEPEVICIRGHWGVGKTYSWNRYFNDARAEKDGVTLKHYAYVSLFGITSLDELKYAIFENTVGTARIEDEPGVKGWFARTKEGGKEFSKKKALPVLQQVPIAKGYIGGITPVLSFMAVRETII